MPIYFACTTICFRKSPIEEALREIRKAGFNTLELAVIPGFCPHFDAANATEEETEAFVDLIEQSGFSIPTLAAVPGQFNASDADFDRFILAGIANLNLAKRMGSWGMNINCGVPIHGDRSAFKQQAKLVAKGSKAIAREAAALGLRINMEAPHRNGLCRTLDEAEFLMEHIDEPNVNFLADSSHIFAGGVQPAEMIHRFKDKIKHVHLRDCIGEQIFVVPGDGEVNFKEFFQALEDIEYQGTCTVELEGVGETLEERHNSLHRGMKYMISQCENPRGAPLNRYR